MKDSTTGELENERCSIILCITCVRFSDRNVLAKTPLVVITTFKFIQFSRHFFFLLSVWRSSKYDFSHRFAKTVLPKIFNRNLISVSVRPGVIPSRHAVIFKFVVHFPGQNCSREWRPKTVSFLPRRSLLGVHRANYRSDRNRRRSNYTLWTAWDLVADFVLHFFPKQCFPSTKFVKQLKNNIFSLVPFLSFIQLKAFLSYFIDNG